jgi:hypothetical protein
MIGIDPNIVRGLIGSIGLLLAYGYSFWRIVKRNPGNKVVECGSIALVLFLVGLALFRIPNFPVSIIALWFFLVFLLSLLTIGFLVQQGYHALRHRKKT